MDTEVFAKSKDESFIPTVDGDLIEVKMEEKENELPNALEAEYIVEKVLKKRNRMGRVSSLEKLFFVYILRSVFAF